MVRAALRENVLRQFRAVAEFPPRDSGDARPGAARALHRDSERNRLRRSSCSSDQTNGGFYGSQDADQTLDDDGDYFTWTRDEIAAVLTPEEARAIQIYYDVEAHGEMHHNPAKNVLSIASSFDDLGKNLNASAAAARES